MASPVSCSVSAFSPLYQEPLLHTLLAHKWEVFARTQFLLHFAGYLLLEISQTILIWLISDKQEWNRCEIRQNMHIASFARLLLATCLALLLLGIDVLVAVKTLQPDLI